MSEDDWATNHDDTSIWVCFSDKPALLLALYVSLFSQGYGWARYFAKGGGKMDDCTVIVSFVQPDNVAPDAPVPSPLITQRPMRP